MLILLERHEMRVAMATRNVVLTDHHEKVIDGLVKSGRYQNASEVMRDGGFDWSNRGKSWMPRSCWR